MNLTEEKKEPLRQRTPDQKRTLLAMQRKGTRQVRPGLRPGVRLGLRRGVRRGGETGGETGAETRGETGG